MQTFLDLALGGISLGGLYALTAFALSMALATTHVLNIAHGNFIVFGAALATLLLNILKVGGAASVLAVLACFALAGLCFERAFVRPLLGKTPEQILIGSILITFGFALASEALLAYYWARHVDPQPSFSLTFPLARLSLGPITLSGTRLFILLVTAGLIAAFHLFLSRTPLGKAIRAMAQNYEAAVILGMNPRRISATVYLIGIVATAAAGVLLILSSPLDPYEGTRLTLVALTVIIIGGVGNLPGALLGGVVLGVAEVVTSFYAGGIWGPVVYLLVFFAVLLVRPQGLLGGRAA
jgi:branched-chain amino acid transport system permease protein